MITYRLTINENNSDDSNNDDDNSNDDDNNDNDNNDSNDDYNVATTTNTTYKHHHHTTQTLTPNITSITTIFCERGNYHEHSSILGDEGYSTIDTTDRWHEQR